MEREAIHHLENADWEDITKRLTYYVVNLIGLKLGQPGGVRSLPGGVSAEDVVQESIARLLDGRRTWDPDRVDLLPFLMGVAKSLFSNMLNLKETNTTNSEPFDDEANPGGPIAAGSMNPEDSLISKEKMSAVANSLRVISEVLEDDEEAQLVLICLEDGISKPAEIAAESGVEVKKVYQVKRRIRSLMEQNIKPGVLRE